MKKIGAALMAGLMVISAAGCGMMPGGTSSSISKEEAESIAQEFIGQLETLNLQEALNQNMDIDFDIPMNLGNMDLGIDFDLNSLIPGLQEKMEELPPIISGQDVDILSELQKQISGDDIQWGEITEKVNSVSDIEVKQNDDTVTVTLPGELINGMDGAVQMDIIPGEDVPSTVNEDGSVTYTLTKEQYQELQKEFTEAVDQGIQEFVSDGAFGIKEITHSEDFTRFDVTLTSDQPGMMTMAVRMALQVYGDKFSELTGVQGSDIQVNFYGPDGKLLEAISSAQ